MPSLEKGLIISNQQVGEQLWEIEIIAPTVARDCQAGQFVHLKIDESNSPLLRRPISIYDVDTNAGKIILLYRIVGVGTNLISLKRAGENIGVMGPLGKGFTISSALKKVLLVGGGVGIAPLLYLSRVVSSLNSQVTVVHGAANQNQLVAEARFQKLGIKYLPATMDGSAGFHGLVTDLIIEKVNPSHIDFIYCCGPEPMMAAVADYANKHGIPGEVSLEEYMACGVGACLGCARKLKNKDERYVKVCQDGPVFNIDEVELYKQPGGVIVE